MRPVLQGDVYAAARVLLYARPSERLALAKRLIWQADMADRFRKRLGRPHPFWGNGSLMAAANAYPQGRGGRLGEDDFAACFMAVFEALICWRSEQAGFSRRHR